MSETSDTAEKATPAADVDERDDLPGVIVTLGELPAGAIVNEGALARMFGRCVANVKRAIRRGELPPATRLFGQNTWTAGAILAHVNKRLDMALRESERMARKFSELRP
ncbi:MAG: hypothetical protein FJ279_10270 [Planctomycetes bacterium]|nr:hypothetical protein [Planctomycetota bacterium]